MTNEPGIIRDALVISLKKSTLAYVSNYRRVITEKTITEKEAEEFSKLMTEGNESVNIASKFIAWIDPVVPKTLKQHVDGLVDACGPLIKNDQIKLASAKDYAEVKEYLR